MKMSPTNNEFTPKKNKYAVNSTSKNEPCKKRQLGFRNAIMMSLFSKFSIVYCGMPRAHSCDGWIVPLVSTAIKTKDKVRVMMMIWLK